MATFVELLFRQGPNPTTPPAELLFGEVEGLPDQVITLAGALPALQGTIRVSKPTREVAVTGALPGLAGRVRLGTPVEISIVGVLPGLGGRVVVGSPRPVALLGALPGLGGVAHVHYDVAVDRPITALTESSWQQAAGINALTEDRCQPAVKLRPLVVDGWRAAAPLRAGVESRKPRSLMPVRVSGEVRRSPTFVPTRVAIQSSFGDLAHVRLALQALHQAAEARRVELESSYQDRLRLRRGISDGAQTALALRRFVAHQHTVALPLRVVRGSRWQEAMVPPPGYGWQPPVSPAADPCYLPDPNLVFAAAAAVDGNLLFICDRHPGPGPQEPIIVPVRRVYMVTNSVSLVRVSDGMPIRCESIGLTLDEESWAWGATLALPASEFDLVAPTLAAPVDLLATINGTQFRLLAEQVSRERVFGSSSLRVQCRGRIAELDAPYAAAQTFGNSMARTAQQLMADVLTDNGVPLPWAIDWALDDWLVPAGIWSHQGTYISALAAIAKAAGGYLRPHASAASISVLHRYPVAPWDWADVTPDLVLPAAVARRESKTWETQPAYNRVFVAPQARGLQGYQVTRDGSAGDLVAPLVVDSLMTDVAAVRQRSRVELGKGGRQVTVGLGLPVLAETGIILPGTFVQYEDGADVVRGLVRSVSVESRFPTVWQSIGVETRV